MTRGGSWADAPKVLRSANRGWDTPGYPNSNDGLRVARTMN